MLLLLGGCVKKTEYDALQIENQTLQTRVDETNHLLEQSQADLSALQAQMQQFVAVQTTLKKTQLELSQSQEELKALKAQFDRFHTQRRSAMVVPNSNTPATVGFSVSPSRCAQPRARNSSASLQPSSSASGLMAS